MYSNCVDQDQRVTATPNRHLLAQFRLALFYAYHFDVHYYNDQIRCGNTRGWACLYTTENTRETKVSRVNGNVVQQSCLRNNVLLHLHKCVVARFISER